MYLFLDSEFDGSKLISIGLVDQTGLKTFYAEVANIDYNKTSLFVQDVVVPLLELNNLQTKEQISTSINEWLSSFNEKTTIVYDYRDDLKHLKSLVKVDYEPLFFIHVDDEYTETFNNALDEYFRTGNRHHALEDAKAMLFAVNAVKAKHPDFDLKKYMDEVISKHPSNIKPY